MEGGTKGEREGEGEGEWEGEGGREGDREEERKDERKEKTDTGKEEEQRKEWYISETTCNNIDDNKLDITHTHTHTLLITLPNSIQDSMNTLHQTHKC